jgi:2-methylcitrate dehydratase PrpD
MGTVKAARPDPAQELNLSDRLASYCIAELPSRISEATRRSFQRVLLDYCGVALAGSTVTPNAVMRRALLPTLGGSPSLKASVVGDPAETWAPVAALLNGASAHSIELDDLNVGASMHPGAIVFPAAMAMAEAADCDGETFMRAAIAGYEATVRVGLWITPSALFARGYHPTGVVGVYGAAAAAAVVLGLSAQQLSRAFGIASDLASGLMDFGISGSWSKRIHTGWPAHGGCIAALLARDGFVGSESIFESRAGVIFAATGSTVPKVAATPAPGEPLAIEATAFKRHACCRFGHTSLDILLDLKAEHRLDPRDVDEIVIGMFRDGMFLAEPPELKRRPKSMVDAQFSLQYAAAAAFVHGRASLPEFVEERLSDPEVLALAQRIRVEHRADLDALFPACYPSDVKVRTKAGSVIGANRTYTVGDSSTPLNDEQLDSKFATLAGAVLSKEQTDELRRAVAGVTTPHGPRNLGKRLRVSRTPAAT